MENSHVSSVTLDGPIEDAAERIFYDAIDLKDCESVRCAHLDRTGGANPTISCGVSSIDICPAVMADRQKEVAQELSLNTEGALDYIGSVREKNEAPGQVSSPGLQEYEVWCRETCEDTAIILAENLAAAQEEAGHMVTSGQLYPAGSMDVLYGARNVDEGEARITLICDHLGEISVVHSKGDLETSRKELKTAGYDVIAAFVGQHDDINDR